MVQVQLIKCGMGSCLDVGIGVYQLNYYRVPNGVCKPLISQFMLHVHLEDFIC